jgi:hypothetical protein
MQYKLLCYDPLEVLKLFSVPAERPSLYTYASPTYIGLIECSGMHSLA